MNPLPSLDEHSGPLLDLFIACEPLFVTYEMSSVRKCIPRADLFREATARGMELTEFDLDKLAICEAEVRAFDVAQQKREQDSAR